jgi:hypothetical protein
MTERNRHLADLLSHAAIYEPDDLMRESDWIEAAREALRAKPSPDDALERELYSFLESALRDFTVGGYAVDRAIAEAEGIVEPGGDIVYQERWLFPDGHWGEWQTFRTKDWDRYPIPPPSDGVEAQVRVAPVAEHVQ